MTPRPEEPNSSNRLLKALHYLAGLRVSWLLLSGVIGFALGAYMYGQSGHHNAPPPHDVLTIVSESGGRDVSVVEDGFWGDGMLTQSRVIHLDLFIENENMEMFIQNVPPIASTSGGELPGDTLAQATSAESIGTTELYIRDEDKFYQLLSQCNGLSVNLLGPKVTQAEAQRQPGYAFMRRVLSSFGCE